MYVRCGVLLLEALWHLQSGRLLEAAERGEQAVRDYRASFGYEEEFGVMWVWAIETAAKAGCLRRAGHLAEIAAHTRTMARPHN